MQVQSYDRNRSRSIAVFLLSVALFASAVAVIIWGLSNPEALERAIWNTPGRGNPVVALPFSLIMAPGLLFMVIYHARHALDRRPLLVLSEQGLFYRDWRAGIISWQDVENCIVVVHEREGAFGWRPRETFLEMHLRHAQHYLENAHGRAEFTDDYKRSYFRIPMRNIRAERDELWRAVMTGVVGPEGDLPPGPQVETVQV